MKPTILKIAKYLSIVLLCISCSTSKTKQAPEYTGVDPKVQKLVDEYITLSTYKDIRFYNKVTVGFKKINEGNAVGMCTYGPTFREIDLDTDYWAKITQMSKLILIFHELTHCYCSRGHDYSKDLKYPETESARIAQAFRWRIEGGDRPGYWDDGCPTSIMYPSLLDDGCSKAHYAEYIDEMFDRCKPW